ncbi:MAG: SsrA-binding protein SmpB [Firmicutes bacterium]|nr:SsrA-binding protein SmpB [Bacillota bacterium]
MEEAHKVVAQNRRARHNYFIDETYEAGIELTGSEIKSVRAGRVSLADAFARVKDGEVYLYNLYIAPYAPASRFGHDPRRTRKLLLHKREIAKLMGASQEKGYTLIPLEIYLSHGWAKVRIGLARGKKAYDKRESIAKRDAQRQMQRALREKQKA